MDRATAAPVVVAMSADQWAECTELLAAACEPAAGRLGERIERTVRWVRPGSNAPVPMALSAADRALLRRAHQRRLDALLGPYEPGRGPSAPGRPLTDPGGLRAG